MAKGIIGVDTNTPISQQSIEYATNALGKKPAYWGRYFKTPQTAGGVQYKSTEAALFREHEIRLLPFGRQTNHLGGTEAQGKKDGEANAAAFFSQIEVDQILKTSDHIYFFLDTEPRPGPALSVEYYTGWSKALIDKGLELSQGRITMKPSVYLNRGDEVTCRNLKTAIQSRHAYCGGIMVARYTVTTLAPPQWNSAKVSPIVEIPRPVLIWQYIGDIGPHEEFDGDQINPNYPDVFDHLPIP